MHTIFSYILRNRGRVKLNAKHNLTHSLLKLGALLAIVFILHIGLMMLFEGLSLGDSIWLTLTTATTVGYGDISAVTTEGRIATVLLIYLVGIFILAKVVGDYFDYRIVVREKKTRGHWSWLMKDHIVILNTPSYSGGRYLQRLIKQFRASVHYKDMPIYMLTNQFPKGLPDFITKYDDVAHYSGSSSNTTDLTEVCVTQARALIILAEDENDENSDGRTFDILHRLKDLGVSAKILAECVEDNNRKRLENAGANIVIRPIRAYPEMIVRAYDAPGSELIIENMFNNDGDEYRRFDVAINNLAWRDVVTRLITHDIGIAVAYIDRESGEVVYNPPAKEVPDMMALITICKGKKAYSSEEVKALVS